MKRLLITILLLVLPSTVLPAERAAGVMAYPSTGALDRGFTNLFAGNSNLLNAVVARQLPTGGTNGQALVKVSPTNYDVTWATVSGGGGVTDHGDLTGLGNDHHTQYLNTTRAGTWGDARYSALGHGHAESDVTGLVSDLAGKAAASHTHGLADITDEGTAASRNVPATGDASATEVVLGGDSRMTNARTPTTHSHAESDVTGLTTDLAGKASTTHATAHKSGGSDAIKLDELAAPTDITTLNASTSAHGLAPKLPNDATQFWNGIGGWSVPSGTGGSGGAPTNLLFIVSEASTALNNERVLTNGAGLTWTDGGAGSTLTLAADFGSTAGKVTQGNDGRLSQTTTRGDINVRGASTDGRLALNPIAGSWLCSDGTDVYWANLENTLLIQDDCIELPGNFGSPFKVAASTGSFSAWTTSEAGRLGVLRMNPGTAPGHYASAYNGGNIILGRGPITIKAQFKIPGANMGTASEQQVAQFGLLSANATTNQTSGVVFCFGTFGTSGTTNNVPWCEAWASSAVTQGTFSGFGALSADTWYEVTIFIPTAGTSAVFDLKTAADHASVTGSPVTIASGLPGTSTVVIAGYKIHKTLGSASNYPLLDFFKVHCRLTTER